MSSQEDLEYYLCVSGTRLGIRAVRMPNRLFFSYRLRIPEGKGCTEASVLSPRW